MGNFRVHKNRQRVKIFAETERLILREVLPEDAEGFFEMDSDPEVHRYLGNEPVTTTEQIHEAIRFIRQQYVDNGIGRWSVIDKQTGGFMGWAGLKWITTPINGHIHYYDLGYRLLRKYWGMGIATEAAKASLQYAFDTLQANEVVAITDCGNNGSHNVLLKTGLQFIEVFDLEGTPHNWYEISRKLYVL